MKLLSTAENSGRNNQFVMAVGLFERPGGGWHCGPRAAGCRQRFTGKPGIDTLELNIFFNLPYCSYDLTFVSLGLKLVS